MNTSTQLQNGHTGSIHGMSNVSITSIHKNLDNQAHKLGTEGGFENKAGENQEM